MVLQKLLSFGHSRPAPPPPPPPPSRPVGRMHGGFPAEVLYAEHATDDDTVGGGTYASESAANGILRRNAKRNTERTVSWSRTFDTYEEGGAGAAANGGYECDGFVDDGMGGVGLDATDTFESLDTLGRREGREDDRPPPGHHALYPGGMGYHPDDAVRDTSLLLPPVSLSASEEYDGAVEVELPGAPKQQGRKHLATTDMDPQQMDFRNLACVSAASEGTLEMMRDRYSGLGGENEEGEEINVKAGYAHADRTKEYSFNEKEGEQPGPDRAGAVAPTQDEANASAVFIPRELELPDQVDIAQSYSGSLGSLSMEDLAVDDIVNEYAARGAKIADCDSLASFDDQPSWDPNRLRAASDDESLVTLTRKQHEYEPMFRKQHRADATAGHIGLILPFLETFKLAYLDPLAIEGGSGSGTMFESWDMQALKNDLLHSASVMLSPTSNTLGTVTTSRTSKFKSSTSTSFSKSGSEDGSSVGDRNNGSVSRSIDSSEGRSRAASMDEGRDDVVYSKSSATTYDDDNETEMSETIGPDPSGDYIEGRSASLEDRSSTEETTRKKGTRSIEELDITNSGAQAHREREGISNENLMDKESASTASSPEEEEDMGSDDSTEVNSAQLSSHGSEDELSAPGLSVGHVIPIQDLGKSKKTMKCREEKSKAKRRGSFGFNNERDGISQLPQVVVTDPASVWSEDASLETQGTSIFSRGSKKKLSWGRKKKNKPAKKKAPQMDGAPNNHGGSNTFFRDIFHPRPLPPGRVYEGDEGSISGASQISSCMTTESILSELKLIEDTAKLVYNQYVKAPEFDEADGSSHNNIAAIFSSPCETELVLSEPETRPMDDVYGKSGQRTEEWSQSGSAVMGKRKKGGKFKKLLVRFKGKKKMGVAVTWTPKE